MIRPKILVWRGAAAAGLLAAAGLGACAPRPADGQSQVVDGLRFDYGLVASGTGGAPPAAHPDPSMHGGAPRRPGTYHLVLSVTEARSGRPADVRDAAAALSGPGHPGQAGLPLEPMTVNGRPTFARYIVLPEPGDYRLEFRARAAGRHQPVRARFRLQRPS